VSAPLGASRHAVSPFLRKLAHGAALTADDRAVLTRLAEPVHHVGRGDILHEGAEPRAIVLVLDGWAYRYKQLETGMRQITAIYLSGDLCEPFGALPRLVDDGLAAATPAVLARVSPRALRDAARDSPRIDAALWWDLLASDALARDHMVSLGRRAATERLANFFCQVHQRLALVGLADGESFAVPLTQTELADLFGLSTVHVNRSLQELRRSGLLSLQSRRATILDLPALRELAMFDLACFAADRPLRFPAAAGHGA
jgi:CRP-like cAMP-binding protein